MIAKAKNAKFPLGEIVLINKRLKLSQARVQKALADHSQFKGSSAAHIKETLALLRKGWSVVSVYENPKTGKTLSIHTFPRRNVTLIDEYFPIGFKRPVPKPSRV